ncbi:hypothetical protein SARC_10808 [Sphaeroforma arctica JP610]|uniref:GT23 domain-containing protein n=1 Tax=Sphaeroforma arctica JP610 TaxID=667725 RepID=A0A0L0FIU9_9EUKA|nr:hypothetical protein SARC_10808 [Sphaeroforma arctica JP610]KNC76707.1 hypothetical protein SARC_10808 [Sphaeroforma arctica JP610]|eukprot:XP_014150609.1 hypothetical protein SARC_10808 [Sphaeroforma arctica JP610]
MAEMNASCIAAATIFQHQMCDLPCDQAIYMTTWESGTGSGTRWHTYMNAITRTVGTDTMVRLWSTKPFQSYVTSECASGDEWCYFSVADDCIDRASPNSVANTTKENLVTYTYGKSMKTFTPALREGLNRSEMWLQSQVLFFILQPKQFIRDWVDEFWSANSTTRFSTNDNIHKDTPYLIMHVRWGDKCAWSSAKRGRESICVPFRKYMEQANAFRALNPELNHIILSSTDPKAIKMTRRHTNWTFSWIVAERKLLSQQNHMIPAKEKLGEKQMVDIKALMTEFYLAAYADYAVVTASSGWSRAFLRWSRALRGHIIPNACLDDWNWDASIVGLNDSRLPEIRDAYRESLGTERYCFAHRENCSEVFS